MTETHRPVRILVLGGGFVNKGAEAMLRTVQRELHTRIPGAQFMVGHHPIFRSPEEANVAADAGFHVVANPGLVCRCANLALGKAWFLPLLRGAISRPLAA